MCRLLFICFVMCAVFSCKKDSNTSDQKINSVIITTVVEDSLLNVRALEINKEDVVIATSEGQTLCLKNGQNSFKKLFEKDSIYTPNFRALAITDTSIFTVSIANPALLYKDGVLVYKEEHEKVFYNAIDFWNNAEGIAIGDSTDGCLSILTTRDGGETWKKTSCDDLPKGAFGAFAASDTNIAIIGNKTWVATGGKVSMILYSDDKGDTWESFSTPIVQGLDTTGIYSVDFYTENFGFAIGGDYTKPKANLKNKIKTTDGGKTWQVVSKGKGPGYRSCVQFMPNKKRKELVAVGIEGIDYSPDFGETWKHLSDEGFYTLRFLNDSIAYAAGNGSVARLKFQ